MTIPQELKTILAVGLIVGLCAISSHTTTVFASESEADHELRIFSLQHANARELTHLVSDLLDGRDFKAVADVRTNSIAGIGSPAALAMAEAVLAKLDRPEQPSRLESQRAKKTIGSKQKPAATPAAAKKFKSPVSGRIEFLIERGAKVKKGQLLAAIVPAGPIQETPTRRAAREAAERNQQAATSRRAAANRSQQLAIETELALIHKRLELTELKLAHDKAEADLEQWLLERELASAKAEAMAISQRLKLLEDAVAAGTLTAAEVPKARAESVVSENHVEMRERKLRFHQSHNMPLRIALAELAVLESKSQLEKLELQRRRHLDQMKADEAAAQLKQKLNEAQRPRAASQRQIFAPHAGIVSYEGPLQLGSQVRQKQALLTITSSPQPKK